MRGGKYPRCDDVCDKRLPEHVPAVIGQSVRLPEHVPAVIGQSVRLPEHVPAVIGHSAL